MKTIDYIKIEKDYMVSPMSIDDLAKKHGVSRAQLFRYAKAHGWREKRDALRQAQTDRLVSRELVSQEEAWLNVQNQMRQAISMEWEKMKACKNPNGQQLASLARATKDARDMGVFGASLVEKKMTKEIAVIEKHLQETDGDKDDTIEIRIEGGEGLDG